ncbi:MAG: type II secretion system major pseudopilin GspG [Pseudomonadota bacterium]
MQRNRKRNRLNRGFTLVELMAVVLILGLLTTIVTVGITRQVERAKVKATAAQVAALGNAITTFHLECGFFPSSLQDLFMAPTSGRACKGYPPGGFLEKKEIPLDPWGNAYNYTAPGVHSPESYDLWSNGPDGDEGTADDIVNWASEKTEETK